MLTSNSCGEVVFNTSTHGMRACAYHHKLQEMKYSITWQKWFSHSNGRGLFLGEVVDGLQFWDKCCLNVDGVVVEAVV